MWSIRGKKKFSISHLHVLLTTKMNSLIMFKLPEWNAACMEPFSGYHGAIDK